MSFFAWIILGLISGFVASRIVNHRGAGLVRDVLLGVRESNLPTLRYLFVERVTVW